MGNPHLSTLAAALSLSLLLAACASDPEPNDGVGEPAQVSHIHGLGVGADGTLYVATHTGLIRRDGNAWVYASADRNDHMGFSLHPEAGVMYRSGHSLDKPSLGVERSTDGARWTHLSDVADPPVDFHAMAVSFADADVLWGWDSGGRGTFRSTDGGTSWSRLDTQRIERQIYALAGPTEGAVVLAGTASGLYRSEDAGRTWTPVDGLGEGWVAGVAADPGDAERILVAAQEGLKITHDRGRTWADAGATIPVDAEIAHVAIAPGGGGVAYAADSSRVWRTDDGGTTWVALD